MLLRARHNCRVSDDVGYARCLFLEGTLCKECQDPYVKLSALVGALVHDLQHPGFTNGFLKATNHPLVEKFGDEATSEKMHVAVFKQILAETETNFLQPLEEPERSRVLDLVEKMVLATDMSRHVSFVEADFPSAYDELLVFKLSLAMKTADLSPCYRNFKIHNAFVDMLKAEFYLQGDFEKSLGAKGTSYGMNREESSADVALSQVHFLSLFIRPLFAKWQNYETTLLITQAQAILERNIESWTIICTAKRSNGPEFADGKAGPRSEKNANLPASFQESLRKSQVCRMHSIVDNAIQEEALLRFAVDVAEKASSARHSVELGVLTRVPLDLVSEHAVGKRRITAGQLALQAVVL